MNAKSLLLFQRRGSWVERLDPRVKLIFTLLSLSAVVVGGTLVWGATLALALLMLWHLARLPWRPLLYIFATTGLLFLSTMVFHVVATGSLAAGLYSGGAMCLRITGVILTLAFLVHSTAPLELAEGMESLLSPLKRWRVPVHDGVMIFTIALRFLPVLLEEFDKIRKAQIARGGGFHRGTLPQRIRGLLPLLVPVIVQSLLRAEQLATAMEARCYRGDEGRTPPAPFHASSADVALVVAAVVGLASTIAMRWFF